MTTTRHDCDHGRARIFAHACPCPDATPGEYDNDPPTCDVCGSPPCDPGCPCSGWNGDTGAHRGCEAQPDPYDERRAAEREEAYQRAHQDDAPPAYQGVEL